MVKRRLQYLGDIAAINQFAWCCIFESDSFKNGLQKLQARVILPPKGHKNKYQT